MNKHIIEIAIEWTNKVTPYCDIDEQFPVSRDLWVADIIDRSIMSSGLIPDELKESNDFKNIIKAVITRLEPSDLKHIYNDEEYKYFRSLQSLKAKYFHLMPRNIPQEVLDRYGKSLSQGRTDYIIKHWPLWIIEDRVYFAFKKFSSNKPYNYDPHKFADNMLKGDIEDPNNKYRVKSYEYFIKHHYNQLSEIP